MSVEPDDDDRLREALRRDAPPPQAAAVLSQLQPAMRRSRSHRRIAVGTATALLVFSGGAAVLTVNAALPGPERRSSTTLPGLTDANRFESTSTAPDTSNQRVTVLTSPDAPREPASSLEPGTTSPADGTLPTPTTPPSPSPTPPPAPGAVVTHPTATAAPTTPAAPVEVATVAPAAPAPPATTPAASSSTRTVSSECGAVVIGIDGQRIHVESIAPAPGFTSQVSTDGPETIELVLVASPKKCEIHVESEDDGLHVEVQDGS